MIGQSHFAKLRIFMYVYESLFYCVNGCILPDSECRMESKFFTHVEVFSKNESENQILFCYYTFKILKRKVRFSVKFYF